MKKLHYLGLILTTGLMLPFPAFALTDTRPKMILWFIELFWILGVLALIVYIVISFAIKLKKSTAPTTPLINTAGQKPLKKSHLKKALIILGILIVVPVLIGSVASYKMFTFKYSPSENVAKDIVQLAKENMGRTTLDVLSWKTPVGRIYAVECLYLSDAESTGFKFIQTAKAQIDVNEIAVPLYGLGCEDKEITYFNAWGKKIAYCGTDLACIFISSHKADYTYSSK